MFINDEKTRAYIGCFIEKLVDFGFEKEEAIIILMNAANNTSLEKILKAIDFIEPVGSGVVRDDIDKETAESQIIKLLTKDGK